MSLSPFWVRVCLMITFFWDYQKKQNVEKLFQKITVSHIDPSHHRPLLGVACVLGTHSKSFWMNKFVVAMPFTKHCPYQKKKKQIPNHRAPDGSDRQEDTSGSVGIRLYKMYVGILCDIYIYIILCTKTPSRKMKSSKVKWIDKLNVQLLFHWTLLHFSLRHTSSLGGRQLLGKGGLKNLQKWLQHWLNTFFNPPRTDIWNIVFWQGLTVWLHSDLKMLMILSTKSHSLTIAGHASFKTGILLRC